MPRRIWVNIHISLGLTLGLLWVLLGLTGSICVYRDELDTLLNPHLVLDDTRGAYLPLDKLMAAVRAAHPARHAEWVLELPRRADGMVTAWYEKPHETFGEGYAPLMVSVNPYTGAIVANRFWGHTVVTWVDDWHTHLQAGLSGGRVVGGLGVLLALSVGSGLWLWWPGWSGLRRAFRVRPDLGWRRLLHDLHGLTGLAFAPLLLLLALTGVHLAYPAALEAMAGAAGMGHGEDGPPIRSTAVPNNHPVSLAEAVVIARGPFPHADVRRIAPPVGEDGTYRVNLRRPGEVNIRHPVTMVWIDRWSGQIRDVRNPSRLSGSQQFVTGLWPLHTGERFGAFGRWLWCVTGVVPLLLYASGLTQFLMRRGVLADRAVDVARLRYRWRQTQRQAWRVALWLWAVTGRCLRWALQQGRVLWARLQA